MAKMLDIDSKPAYVILDTKENKFYAGENGCSPWIIYAFTEDIRRAYFFTDLELVEKLREKFSKTRYEFDGNTPICPTRLKVCKLGLTMDF